MRLQNHRRPLAPDARRSNVEVAQIARCLDPQGEATIEEALADELVAEIESVDVVAVASGEPRYQLYLWPSGSGILFEHGTTTVVADVVQHWFDQRTPDPALRDALAVAFREGAQRLGLSESIDFTPPRMPPPPAGSEIDVAIASMRAELAAGRRPNDDVLWKLVLAAFDRTYRPVPVRRLHELTPTERAALELLADAGKPGAIPYLGFPLAHHFFSGDPQPLLRYLGRAPAGPLDEKIELEGASHPVWCLVRDVLDEVRPAEPVLARLCALPDEQLAALWETLVRTTDYGLRAFVPRTTREDREQGTPKHFARVAAYEQHLVDLLVRINTHLGARGRELAGKLEPRSPLETQVMRACLEAGP